MKLRLNLKYFNFRSEYFMGMFSSGWMESSGESTLKLQMKVGILCFHQCYTTFTKICHKLVMILLLLGGSTLPLPLFPHCLIS